MSLAVMETWGYVISIYEPDSHADTTRKKYKEIIMNSKNREIQILNINLRGLSNKHDTKREQSMILCW